MKKLIIVMGHLAAYKTTIAKKLSEDLNLLMFNKDEIKESLVDDIGFKTREENLKLSAATNSILKYNAISVINRNIPLILESNFKYHELEQLKEKIKDLNVLVFTLFLSGKAEILYDRYCNRQPSRHSAHTSTGLMSFDVFKSSMFPYDQSLLLGESYLVDTTIFTNNEYQDILNKTKTFLIQ